MPTSTPSRLFRGAAAAAGLVLALVLAGAAAPARALEPGEFDPAAFDSLLSIFVFDKGVDYAAWKASGTEGLDRFLEQVGGHDLTSTLGKEPRAAFLINAYNAWAIRQVLEHYPVDSFEAMPGFFDQNAAPVAGEPLTLNGIEAKLAEIYSHNPYFAFALAPGAKGMPPVAPQAYTSDELAKRLTKAAGVYLAESQRVRYDRENKVVHLPPQFQIHWTLFENQPQGLVGFLANHLALADVMAVSRDNPDYAFDPVDWTLRDASDRNDDDTGNEKP